MPDRPEKTIPKPLLALVLTALAGGCAWAIFCAFAGNSPPWRGEGSGGESEAQILSANLKRDYQNGILTLEIAFENTTGNPVRLEPPFVGLAAGTGTVFAYNLDAASRPDPAVVPGQKNTVTLHFWLEPGHFAEPLELTVGTDKFPVKSEAAFDIQSVENQAILTLTSPDWTRSD